jgi:hypothetical protein
VQALQVDRGLAQGRDQPQLALGVLEEQVLGVAAGQGRLDLQPFLDAEHRRVVEGGMGDAVGVEKAKRSERVFIGST